MKKNFLKMVSILMLGLIGISASAQGTWKATGTETAVAPSTEISYIGISNLSVMHSDANVAQVIGKADALATTVSYNTITYDNLAFIQGATNGMYYAFRPTITGTLDIAVKMSSAKTTFVLELTDLCPNNADLAALTTTTLSGADITGFPTYFTTPSVYDTYNATTGTWDGTVAIQSSGVNQYLVMSFPVTANKTYVVGVNGSKLMLRGVNLTLGTGIAESTANAIGVSPNPASGSVNINVEEATEIAIYNTSGSLLIKQLVGPSDNSVDISALAPGVYFVKDTAGATQKLIVK